jgi:hypothetical protein
MRIRSRTFGSRPLDGRWLHAHLGAIVASCLSLQCGGQSANDDRSALSTPNLDEGEPDDDMPSAGNGGTATPSPGSEPAGGAGGLAPGPERTPADAECNAEGAASLVSGIAPTEPVDEMALYQWDGMNTPTLLERAGEPCVSESCPDLSGSPPGSGFDKSVQAIVYQYFAYRRGETAGYVLDQQQLLDFLGEIDTPNEAAMVLWGVYRPVACDALFEEEDGSYFTSGEYSVSICPVTNQRFDITISPTGVVNQQAVGSPVEEPICVGRRPEYCGPKGLGPPDPPYPTACSETTKPPRERPIHQSKAGLRPKRPGWRPWAYWLGRKLDRGRHRCGRIIPHLWGRSSQ